MSDEDVDMSDAAIFADTSGIIRDALAKIHENHQSPPISRPRRSSGL